MYDKSLLKISELLDSNYKIVSVTTSILTDPNKKSDIRFDFIKGDTESSITISYAQRYDASAIINKYTKVKFTELL